MTVLAGGAAVARFRRPLAGAEALAIAAALAGRRWPRGVPLSLELPPEASFDAGPRSPCEFNAGGGGGPQRGSIGRWGSPSMRPTGSRAPASSAQRLPLWRAARFPAQPCWTATATRERALCFSASVLAACISVGAGTCFVGPWFSPVRIPSACGCGRTIRTCCNGLLPPRPTPPGGRRAGCRQRVCDWCTTGWAKGRAPAPSPISSPRPLTPISLRSAARDAGAYRAAGADGWAYCRGLA